MISPPGGVLIWLVAGFTDFRQYAQTNVMRF